MSADASAICTWLSSLASTIVTDKDDAADLASRLAAASALPAADLAAESLALMRVIGESVKDAAGFNAIKAGQFDDDDTVHVGAILFAVGLALAGARAGWISRPQARAARDRISAAGDTALAAISSIGAEASELYGWLSNLVQISVRLVSDEAANAVPVVRVESGISLPSTVLAYKLYGDASRAGGLVEVAGSATPMLMPVAFDALES